jgi:glycosyltransferase involved in cell wall biosynthesis
MAELAKGVDQREPTISVILCTHDPRTDYMQRTLDGLRTQTMPLRRWELLVVDNASREPLAGQWDLGWHPNARHVLEEELGLTQARLRGIRESVGELLVFVDDDNVLQPDYLVQVEAIAAQHRTVGCFGAARLLPRFEEEPSSELLPYTGTLALRDEPTDQRSADPLDWAYPYGAGLVVRRAVADAYVRVVSASRLKMELDRRGDQLNSCGDDEFSWIAIDLGFERGVFRALVVHHLIAAKRVRKEYLLSLYESFGYSRALLLHSHGMPAPQPIPDEEEGDPGWRVALRHLLSGRISAAVHMVRSQGEVDRDTALIKEFEGAQRAGFKRFQRTHLPSAN